jgi:cobalt-zinc-cadmium efflux system outer membrane protein
MYLKSAVFTASFALSFVFAVTNACAGEDLLTPGKAVEAALANNGELAAARQEMGIREAAKVRAGQWPNPQIEIEGAYAGASENVVSAGISQEILTGGKLRKRISAAGKDISAYSHELEDAERRLKAEVKNAYWDAVFAEKALELSDRTIELNRELVRVAEERALEGDIPELELTLSRVELGRAEERKLKAQTALAEARAQLFTLIGVPDEGAKLEDPSPLLPACPPEEMKAAAIANRPDVKALSAVSEKADADFDAARAERWPDVTVSLFYEHENSAIESGSAELKDRDNFVGLRLSAPIPVFNRNQGGIMEARANKGAAVTRRESLEARIKKEVDLACRRLELARGAIEVYREKIIPQQDENLRLMQEAYRLGEVGILNITEEQKKFVELNEGYISSRREAVKAVAAVEAAIGAELDGGMK